MGFGSDNSNYKPMKYISLGRLKDKATQETVKVFFQEAQDTGEVDENNRKVYKYINHLSSNNNPLPFYGFLKKLAKREFTTKTGGKITKLSLSLVDSGGENYMFDIGYLNEKSEVRYDASSLLNTLAGVPKFGLMKFFIYERSVEATKKVYFDLKVRNLPDWKPEMGVDNSLFAAPKNASLPDPTKVKWKYEIGELPKPTKMMMVDGEEMEVKNKAYHPFYDELIDSINAKIAQDIPTYGLPEEYLSDYVKNAAPHQVHAQPSSHVGAGAAPAAAPITAPAKTYEVEVESNDDLPF